MVNYREANKNDWQEIAELHALSWQQNYRGALTDDYLDNIAMDDRREIWKKRFTTPNKNQLIILAEKTNMLIGFSCIFLDADEKYGALLDNLHVHSDFKRQGIGKILMQKSAALLLSNKVKTPLYLWVVHDNSSAIKFYEKVGGLRKEPSLWKTPDKGSVNTYRYVWYDLEKLTNLN